MASGGNDPAEQDPFLHNLKKWEEKEEFPTPQELVYEQKQPQRKGSSADPHAYEDFKKYAQQAGLPTNVMEAKKRTEPRDIPGHRTDL
eukprot:jgi/Chlat1/2995/Chrsp2S08922